MIVTLENVESIDGSNWLERPNLEDVESTGGGYLYCLRLERSCLEDVESTGGG